MLFKILWIGNKPKKLLTLFVFKIKMMKTIYSLILFFLMIQGITAQEFQFEKETIDYGKIDKNSEGKRVFVFKNIGKAPIIITKVKSSCGCTIPKKPENPIMPGEKGEITVSYDTRRVGGFHKTITVFSNAKTKIKMLKIKGYVSKGISLEKEKSILSN